MDEKNEMDKWRDGGVVGNGDGVGGVRQQMDEAYCLEHFPVAIQSQALLLVNN